MAIFPDEDALQVWLRSHFAAGSSLGDLILEEEGDKTGISGSLARRMLATQNYCRKAFHTTEVLSDDSNISSKIGEILRPDFILYDAETQSILIVELKVKKAPTREAGTETNAYAAELRSYFPLIAQGDLIIVVISEEWPPLLRHYISNEVFWLQNKVIGLKPVMQGSEIKLQVDPISEYLVADYVYPVSERHVGGYELCLYDKSLYDRTAPRSRLDNFLPQMKSALCAVAAQGASHRGHGFAFLWKDLWQASLAPYHITLCNFAAFQSLEQLLLTTESYSGFTRQVLRMIKDNNPTGHGASLDDIAEVGRRYTRNFSDPRSELYASWKPLRNSMIQRCELISFQAWGAFQEAFFDRLQGAYSAGQLSFHHDDPQLGLEVVDELISLDKQPIDLSHFHFDEDN